MREIRDAQGRTWQAVIASHGTTSRYLNPKVHRSVVQFSCVTEAVPRRYGPLPSATESLDELDEAFLLALLEQAKVY